MIYKEALDILDKTFIGNLELKIVLTDALKKQIPTSISKSWRDARGYTNTFICGKCEAHIQMPYMMNKCDYEYCPYCGNRLG